MSQQWRQGRTCLAVTFQQQDTTPACVSSATDVTAGPEPLNPVNGSIHAGKEQPGGHRAGLRVIVQLPRRWNPAGSEPLARHQDDAAGEERGDSEMPGVPKSPLLAGQGAWIPGQKEAKTPELPGKGLPEKGLREKSSPRERSPREKTHRKKFSQKKSLPEKLLPEKSFPEKSTLRKRSPRKNFSQKKLLPEKSLPEKSLPGKKSPRESHACCGDK